MTSLESDGAMADPEHLEILANGDVDLRSERIRWRAENGKLKHEHVTPLSVDAIAALEDERQRNPAVGEAWIFPAP